MFWLVPPSVVLLNLVHLQGFCEAACWQGAGDKHVVQLNVAENSAEGGAPQVAAAADVFMP